MENSPSPSPDRKSLLSRVKELASEPVHETGLLLKWEAATIAAMLAGALGAAGVKELFEQPKEEKNDAPVVVPMEDGQNQKLILSDDLPAVRLQPEPQSS